MGNDKTCVVVGMRHVQIAMDDGWVRTLCDVQHILELRKNLISLGTLQANGFTYKTDRDRNTLRVCKWMLTLMKAQHIVRNIDRLLGSTIIGRVASVESDDDATILWHLHLDNLNECGMVEIHKRGLLKRVCSYKLDLCEYCVLAKKTNMQFKAMKHTTIGILDCVHIDVWGPIRDSSLGGSHYFMTFSDDFSCNVWVYHETKIWSLWEVQVVEGWGGEPDKHKDQILEVW